MKPETFFKTTRMLDLSTQHLTPATLKSLERLPLDPALWPFAGCRFPFGFALYAQDDRSDDIADDLWACFEHARQVGCSWVRFDCEADTDPVLAIQSPPHAQRTKDPSDWRVTWTIDVTADTPQDAALEAWRSIRRPGTTATVFDVSDRRTEGIRAQIDVMKKHTNDKESLDQ